MRTAITEYDGLLAGLSESREHLRVMQVGGEQQNLDLAKAFYRIDSAAAAIQALLAQTGDAQPHPVSKAWYKRRAG